MVLRFENPFASKTGETDVTINTEQETLYLHSRILSIYSPKFKEIFFNQHGDDVPLTFHGDSAQDVILFFKMFYPEHKLKIIHELEIIETNAMKGVLENSLQYQTSWMSRDFDELLCSPTYQKGFTESLDSIFNILVIADKYNLTKLKEKLALALKSQSFAQCSTHSRFKELKVETQVDILVQRLKFTEQKNSTKLCYHHTNSEYPKEVVRSITDTLMDIGGVTRNTGNNDEDQTFDEQDTKLDSLPGIGGATRNTVNEIEDQQFVNAQSKVFNIQQEKHEADEQNQDQNVSTGDGNACTDYNGHFNEDVFDADVLVQLEDGPPLKLHSAVLSHCSPVLKAMLAGNFAESQSKKILLPDKKRVHFFELMQLCYVNKPSKLSETTNYYELLSLCREYLMNWLIKIMEGYLVKSTRFNRREEASGLVLSEEFQLDKLRNAILEDARDLKVLKDKEPEAVAQLSDATKYMLTRTSLVKHWYMFSQNNGNSEEQTEVFHFLDSCFKE